MWARTRILPIKSWYESKVIELGRMKTSDIQIITPNQRLSLVLHRHWANLQSEAGIQVWDRPQILPLNLWLNHHWHLWRKHQFFSQDKSKLFSPISILISKEQEISIWRDIIEKDSSLSENLLNKAQVSQLAQETYLLMKNHCISEKEAFNHESIENESFEKWVKLFENKCKSHHWLVTANLSQFLLEQHFNSELNAPTDNIKYLGVYGFNEISPNLDCLLVHLEAQGTQIETLELEPLSHHKSQLLEFNTEEEELVAALNWAQKKMGELESSYKSSYKSSLKIDQSFNEKKPPNEVKLDVGFSGPKIGIIVPNLHEKRKELANRFSDLLNKNYNYFIDDLSHQNTLNISASESLLNYPLIIQSFNIIELCGEKVSSDFFGNFLVSPYWKTECSMAYRMQIKNDLSKFRQREYSVFQWVFFLKDSLKKEVQELNQLSEFIQKKLAFKKQDLYRWSKTLFEVFKLMGWPGDFSLISEEYQLWTKLCELISNLPAFGALSASAEPVSKTTNHSMGSSASSDQKVSFKKMLGLLRICIQKTTFQPQALSDKIQVLGALEAAGIPFDAIWIMGLDNETWPAKPKPNPLLSIHLQRKKKLPHSSAIRELEFTKTYLDHLKLMSPEINFSFSKQKGDQHLSACPLLLPLKLSSLQSNANEAHSESGSNNHFEPDKTKVLFESYEDEAGLPYQSNENLPGGVSHFKAAAQCSFMAYAKYRFSLKTHLAGDIGLTPLEKGNIIHQVLENFWREILSQEGLVKLDSQILEEKIRDLLNQSSQKYLSADLKILSQTYLQQEKNRLISLILETLELEKNRYEFKVLGVEKAFVFKIDQLNIKARVDRIDELEEGTILVVDYKTGEVSRQQWHPDKLTDPQLPIYACFTGLDIQGIAFLKIKTKKIEYLYWLDEDISLMNNEKNVKNASQKPPLDWKTTKDNWQKRIEILAQGIQDGLAWVNPLEGEKTCNVCDYSSLCRIRKNL